MALTKPFINNIPAFNAISGTNLYINVLGGDTINGYNYKIYSNYGSTAPIYTSGIVSVTNDVASRSVRTFEIDIPQSSLTGLQNNNMYKIEPIIYSDDETEGVVGQQTFFMCYADPSIKLQIPSLNEQSAIVFKDLESGDIVSSSKQQFRLVFNSNDLNSEARPNIAELTLYGVLDNNQRDFISTYEDIYTFTRDTNNINLYYANIAVNGFSLTVDKQGNLLSLNDRKYKAFEIMLSIRTIENMNTTITYSNLACYYEVLTNSPYLVVNNICNKGVMEVNCKLTSKEGDSNISLNSLIYTSDGELDLRHATYNEDVYVQWQKYFTLKDDYTAEIWGRNFDGGLMATFYSSLRNDYIKLYYETEDVYNDSEQDFENYTFIRLESVKYDNNGQPMFPYTIESQRILTSEIDETTELFIAIQKQSSLFDIDFEIVN